MRTLIAASLALPIALLPVVDITPCTEQADLTPPVADIGDECGYAVAAEGSRMAVGAPNHDGKGAVFIYSFDGTSWDLDSTIIPNQVQTGDLFGYSVSLSGQLLAVSAIGDHTAGTDAGAVYILEETSSTTWTTQEKIVPSELADDIEFGESLSLWDDTVAIGVLQKERVYVYRQSGSSWVEEGDEDGAPFSNPTEATISHFGESVAVYQDTMLVGDDLQS